MDTSSIRPQLEAFAADFRNHPETISIDRVAMLMDISAAVIGEQSARVAELKAQMQTAETTLSQAEASLAAEVSARKRAEQAVAVMMSGKDGTKDMMQVVNDRVRAYGAVAITMRLVCKDVVDGNIPLCDMPAIFADVLHVIDQRYGPFLDIADRDPVSRKMLDAIVGDAARRRQTINEHNARDAATDAAAFSQPSPWARKH